MPRIPEFIQVGHGPEFAGGPGLPPVQCTLEGVFGNPGPVPCPSEELGEQFPEPLIVLVRNQIELEHPRDEGNLHHNGRINTKVAGDFFGLEEIIAVIEDVQFRLCCWFHGEPRAT